MVKKQTEDNNWLRANADQEIENAGSKDRHPVFGKGLKSQIKSKKKEFQKGFDEQNDQNDIEESKKHKYEMMVETFRDEELGSGNDLTEADAYMNEQNKSMMTLKLSKRDAENSGIQNLEMRSLCIAAFLRCLFNSLEYAPDGEFYAAAIENLHSDVLFKSIT